MASSIFACRGASGIASLSWTAQAGPLPRQSSAPARSSTADKIPALLVIAHPSRTLFRIPGQCSVITENSEFSCGRRSGQDRLDHVAMNIRQSEVPALELEGQ